MTNPYLDLILRVGEMAEQGRFSRRAAEDFAHRAEELAFNQIMTRKQCSKFLGVSLRTLDNLVCYRGLPSTFRILSPGKRPQRVFLAAEVLEWQQRHLTGSPCQGPERETVHVKKR